MLKSYKTMEINMLLSIVNMKLRNEKERLHDLCRTYQIDEGALIERFKKIIYTTIKPTTNLNRINSFY